MELLLWLTALELLISVGKDHLPPTLLAVAILAIAIPTPAFVYATIQRGINSTGPLWNVLALAATMAITPWNITRYIKALDPVFLNLPDVLVTTVAGALLVIIPASLYLPVLLRVYSR